MNKVFSLCIIIIGFVIGIYFPELALELGFLGDLFLNYLKMLIIPIIFVSIFLAVANLDPDELKSLGSKTLLYYLSTSFLAALTGFIVSKFFIFSSETVTSAVSDKPEVSEFSFQELILSFMPSNIFNSISSGNIIHIVVFSLLVGLAVLFIKKESKTILINFSNSIDEVLNVLIGWGLKFAPVGIASLIARIIAKTELEVFSELIPLFWAIGLSVGIHLFITLPSLGFFVGRFNPFKYFLMIQKPLLTALATASSSATLPVSIKTLDDSGVVKEKTSGFVLPLGATLNMDGSALYQTLVIFFLAQISGITLDLSSQILVIFIVLISSAGTAGIPAGGMIMMAAVMEMVNIPTEYIAIYVLIDRFWDYPVTMVNVCGDLFAARTVDRFIK